MKGKYVVYLNDSKGFNIFGVLSEKNGKIQLSSLKNNSKFFSERNKVDLFWLQKEEKLEYQETQYKVEHIKWDGEAYYADLRELHGVGEARQVYLEELSKNCVLL